MARSQRAYGRPDTAVFPTGWAAGLQPVAEGAQTSPCTIRKPGTTQTWDDTTEQNVATPLAPYFTGTCRVQALADTSMLGDAAGQPLPLAGYLITIPAAVAPAVGDLITVASTDTVTVDDPQLDGQTFVIRDTADGSHVVERDLYCTPVGAVYVPPPAEPPPA